MPKFLAGTFIGVVATLFVQEWLKTLAQAIGQDQAV